MKKVAKCFYSIDGSQYYNNQRINSKPQLSLILKISVEYRAFKVYRNERNGNAHRATKTVKM